MAKIQKKKSSKIADNKYKTYKSLNYETQKQSLNTIVRLFIEFSPTIMQGKKKAV